MTSIPPETEELQSTTHGESSAEPTPRSQAGRSFFWEIWALGLAFLFMAVAKEVGANDAEVLLTFFTATLWLREFT